MRWAILLLVSHLFLGVSCTDVPAKPPREVSPVPSGIYRKMLDKYTQTCKVYGANDGLQNELMVTGGGWTPMVKNPDWIYTCRKGMPSVNHRLSQWDTYACRCRK